MSFVDLTSSDRWSPTDIRAKVLNLIRREFSETDEAVLNRKLQGKTLGLYTLTASDAALIAKLDAARQAAQAAGAQAIADAALLNTVLDFENGVTLEPLTGAALDLWRARHPA